MKRILITVVLAVVAVLIWGGGDKAETSGKDVTIDPATLAAFAPLPADMHVDKYPNSKALVDLGRVLYYEDRISADDEVSCNSCHDLMKYGVDNLARSPGHKAELGGRNSPTSYNAAGHIAQFWDGRAADVEEQAKGPVLNPVEMAMPDAEHVEAALRSIPGYADLFAAAFPGQEQPITFDNMAIAIGAFERGLVTPARWDAYLGGDHAALTDAEKAGFNTYVSTGCTACHAGAYVGGNMYQKLGLVKAWPELKDNGRYDVTKNEAERYFFKVPSLRNVEKTGPYLHDGSKDDLSQVVSMMAEYQLGRQLGDDDVAAIVAYLGALTGDIPVGYVARPELPAGEDNR